MIPRPLCLLCFPQRCTETWQQASPCQHVSLGVGVLYSVMQNGGEPHRIGAFQKRQPPTLIFRVRPGCAAAPVHIMV